MHYVTRHFSKSPKIPVFSVYQNRAVQMRRPENIKDIIISFPIFFFFDLLLMNIVENLLVPCQNVHKRTLSSTWRAHDGGQFSGSKFSIHAFQNCFVSCKIKYSRHKIYNFFVFFEIYYFPLVYFTFRKLAIFFQEEI